jgi:hypothetical protein
MAYCDCDVNPNTELPTSIQKGTNDQCEVATASGTFINYENECDCPARRRTEEDVVERLLGSVEDYDDWDLEEKVLYHEVRDYEERCEHCAFSARSGEERSDVAV